MCWKPLWHVLEAVGRWELLADAHPVKNMLGRKIDVADAEWLAQLCECGLLRPSFVPPPVVAELRDLTRCRKKLVEERSRVTQRVQRLLENAGTKQDSVGFDILGVSAREMLGPRRSEDRSTTVRNIEVRCRHCAAAGPVEGWTQPYPER